MPNPLWEGVVIPFLRIPNILILTTMESRHRAFSSRFQRRLLQLLAAALMHLHSILDRLTWRVLKLLKQLLYPVPLHLSMVGLFQLN